MYISLEKLLGRYNDGQTKLLRKINKDDENKANKMNPEYNFIPTDEEAGDINENIQL